MHIYDYIHGIYGIYIYTYNVCVHTEIKPFILVLHNLIEIQHFKFANEIVLGELDDLGQVVLNVTGLLNHHTMKSYFSSSFNDISLL